MLALPAAPAPAKRRQLLVGTSLACAAGATFYGGMLALYFRFRQDVLASPDGVWRPKSVIVPEVPTNTMLFGFLGILIFAQWAIYAARRDQKSYVAMALTLVMLLGVAMVNAQAFVYTQMGLGLRDSSYSMFFYTLTGAFLALLIAGMVFTLVTAFRFLGGRTQDREIVTAHAIYWYFMGLIFIGLWFSIYVTK